MDEKDETMDNRILNALRLRLFVVASVAALYAGLVHAADVPSTDKTRVSESSFFADDGRQQKAPNRVSTDVHETSPEAAKVSKAGRGSEQVGASQDSVRSPNTDFWFYDADIELFADEDRDGYFHGIDLLFDADTIYARADVYAVVYLSLDGGPWIEYAETETFAIFGATSDDDYVIVTELLDGYPTGSYDVLIELFDTWDGSFVADIGPENTSELAFLPLEDANLDAPAISTTPVVVNRGGGGGAADWLTVVLLVLLSTTVAVRRRTQRPQAATVERRAPSA